MSTVREDSMDPAGMDTEPPGDLSPAGEAGPPPAPDDGPEDAPVEGRHLLELWSDREEVHALPDILRPAEGLVAVGSGTVVRSGRLSQSRWLVVLTDRRLICIKGRHPATRKLIEMPVSAVRSVQSSGLWRKMLVLETGYGTLRLSGMKKAAAAKMVEGLTALMGAYGGTRSHAEPIRQAELPAPGSRAEAAPDVTPEVQAMRERVERLESEIEELRSQFSFLEGLVRANVEAVPHDATEHE